MEVSSGAEPEQVTTSANLWGRKSEPFFRPMERKWVKRPYQSPEEAGRRPQPCQNAAAL